MPPPGYFLWHWANKEKIVIVPAALRLLVNLNQRETIEEIAQGYNQPDVLAALATLFDSEPLEEYPAKIAPLPGFYQFTLWRRPRLKSNNQPLPDDAMRHLGIMLSFPRDITPTQGLRSSKKPSPANHWLNLAGICIPHGRSWRTRKRKLGIYLAGDFRQ